MLRAILLSVPHCHGREFGWNRSPPKPKTSQHTVPHCTLKMFATFYLVPFCLQKASSYFSRWTCLCGECISVCSGHVMISR